MSQSNGVHARPDRSLGEGAEQWTANTVGYLEHLPGSSLYITQCLEVSFKTFQSHRDILVWNWSYPLRSNFSYSISVLIHGFDFFLLHLFPIKDTWIPYVITCLPNPYFSHRWEHLTCNRHELHLMKYDGMYVNLVWIEPITHVHLRLKKTVMWFLNGP